MGESENGMIYLDRNGLIYLIQSIVTKIREEFPEGGASLSEEQLNAANSGITNTILNNILSDLDDKLDKSDLVPMTDQEIDDVILEVFGDDE